MQARFRPRGMNGCITKYSDFRKILFFRSGEAEARRFCLLKVAFKPPISLFGGLTPRRYNQMNECFNIIGPIRYIF